MRDEFNTPRERQEAWATMLGYCLSRTEDQLAMLISNEQYRNNVFGTYPGTYMEHARDILEAARTLPMSSREMKERAEEKATMLGEEIAEVEPETWEARHGWDEHG